MGSTSSFLAPAAAETGLGELPESCLAVVMSYLHPPQICRLATLNRAFREASSADFVWGSKLPLNYADVITRVFHKYDVFSKDLSKRDIYAKLCTPNPFDGGTKEVWLDKITGKTCMSISSNGLAITGIDDRRYWTRFLTEESSWDARIRGSDDVFAILNKFMVGIRSLQDSRFQLPMAKKQRNSAT